MVALNHLYGDEPRGERPCPGGQATAAQEQALNTLWELLKSFIDERERAGVPRTSQEDWGNAIDALKVSYTGEVLEKAVPLTLAQILPGLPSVEHGGSEVLPPHLQEALKHPEKMMVKPPQGPRPRPKVRVAAGEWPKIARTEGWCALSITAQCWMVKRCWTAHLVWPNLTQWPLRVSQCFGL